MMGKGFRYQRAFSMALAVVLLLACFPAGVLTAQAEQADTLEGKTISILGDSISTFTGVSNDTSVNATLSGGAIYYSNGTLGVSRADTWWQQTVDALGLRLLVNNSWSGSCILHTRSGTVGAYADRCVQLHNDQTGEEPDIIAVFLGTNDFSYYQTALGSADIDYSKLITDNGDGTFTYTEPATSCEAYAIMLHKMTLRYPEAEVYCMTMLPRRNPVNSGSDVGQPTAFNAELTKLIERFGCTAVDLESCGITSEPANFDLYMGDKRVHPNAAGMDKMTQALIDALVGQKNASFTVTNRLTNVTADASGGIVLAGSAYTASLTAAAGFDELTVSVTMGGEDITSASYADGKVTIPSVTGDVVVTAVANIDDTPDHYRWEFDGSDLACVQGENALTRLAGSVSDGIISNAYYSLEVPVILRHDQPWVLEWKASGSGWSGMLFSANSSAGVTGNSFLFKTTSDSGFIGFGERVSSTYENYGVALSKLGVDTAAEHVYRVENRIAADGTNMAYLSVDGVDCGAMNNFFIGGSSDQGQTADWLNGRDFCFSYVGASSHLINNCRMEYIAVWEGGETAESLALRYDDRYDVNGKTVEILDAGTPTSYQVGYGVEENTVADTAVVTLEGDTLIATGIGTAKVKLDGVTYEVTVTAAPISLLLLTGQSNMQGSEGDENQSIVCPEGQVYSTYGDRYTMTVDNATNFAPSALTGAGSTRNVNGTTANLEEWPVYLLNERGVGKKGPDSGFAYEWVRSTGEKVWVVNAAHGGTSINVWQPGTKEYEECQALFTACTETLRKEIAAGHFTLSHMVYFWCQGCADRGQSAAWYVKKYLAMHEAFKTELAFDHDSDPATADKTFEMGGIIPVRVGSTVACYRDGVYETENPYAYHESYVDLRFSGPRVAQYWMANNPELTDIWNVCTIGEDWVWMPDGTNGVAAYFQAHYPNGTVDYTPQVAQKTSWYTPTTPKAVHDSIHYNQIGYNEVGRESARNALILLGELEEANVQTTVELVTWDGYTPAQNVAASTSGNSGTLVVPIVSPVYRSKEVTYSLSEGLSYTYYDLLADTALTEGTLTASTGETVSVVKQEPGAYFAGHLSQLPEAVCPGVNLWSALEHDKQFYSPNSGWHVHSSGTVYSVTIPVQPGDRIYATSFGAYGTNGNATSTSSGIRVTFFGEYEAVKSLAPADTYKEFEANGGYLVVPEGAIAVNVPMWTGDDTNELYILSLSHDRTEGICGICGKDSHVHSWGEWETLSLPTADALGTEQRSCACGETESRETEGVWQKYALGDHMQAMPEAYCAGTNLWSVLEHDEQYFLSGGSWGKHSSGSVYSLTIPVQPGDRIYATSFEAYGTNGNATSTSNGIRVTFFDAYGVAKTLSPAETYAEFTANGGYLIAPEGAVAVNVPMWNNSDENELYILSAEHDYVSVITEPTCLAGGCTTHTCTLCGDSYVDSEVAPLGHTPKEAVKENETASGYDLVVYCGICGGELSREHVVVYTPGDINGDGKVNNKDATRLFQYLSGWNVTVVEAALDVNGDGKVNNKDATRLFQYLSGWNVEIC